MRNAIGRRFQIVNFLGNNPFVDSITGTIISYAEKEREIIRQALELRNFSPESGLVPEHLESVRPRLIECKSNLSLALKKMNVLVSDEDDYDQKFLRPDDITVQKMEGFLGELYGRFEDELPVASFSADGKGGIEVTWQVNTRYLQLIIPVDKPAYLFHKESGDFSLEQFSNDYELFNWVDWLLQAVN